MSRELQLQSRSFEIKWKTGGIETFEGSSIRDALNKNGYQNTRLTAIEFYTMRYERDVVNNRVVITNSIIPLSTPSVPENNESPINVEIIEPKCKEQKERKKRSGNVIKTIEDGIIKIVKDSPNGIAMNDLKDSVLDGINNNTWNVVIYKLRSNNVLNYDKTTKLVTIK